VTWEKRATRIGRCGPTVSRKGENGTTRLNVQAIVPERGNEHGEKLIYSKSSDKIQRIDGGEAKILFDKSMEAFGAHYDTSCNSDATGWEKELRVENRSGEKPAWRKCSIRLGRDLAWG